VKHYGGKGDLAQNASVCKFWRTAFENRFDATKNENHPLFLLEHRKQCRIYIEAKEAVLGGPLSLEAPNIYF